MLAEKVVAFLMRLFGREVFEIGRKGLPRYLTRWTVWGSRFGGPGGKPRHNVFLHLFHGGDAEDYCHDHPWPFWSLILWGGYWEITPGPDGKETRTWYGPLSLLKRPAQWQHRVQLPEGRKCWTIIWCGPKERSWGFICPGKGWIPWRQHQASQDAGGTGCE
jgi:hypothetical protein